MYTKKGLIQDLREIFEQWEGLLSELDEPQAVQPGRMDDWSVKDILGHLTAWQKITAARLEAGLHGGEPDFSEWPPEFDFIDEDDVDHINVWIYRRYQHGSWQSISQEWKSRFLEVIGLAEAVPEAVLLEEGKYPWLNQYPLGAVLVGTFNHHKEHLEALQSPPP
jgi:hypothetical protein